MRSKPDIFTPLSREQKKQFLDDYLTHLHRRDGEPDVVNRRFSVREDFFHDLEEHPVHRSGPPVVDSQVFERNERKYHPESGLDPVTLWALAVAKTNRAERDGVEYALARIDTAKMSDQDPYTFILIEEFYHTRVLKDALSVLGLDMHDLPAPKTTRWLTHSLYHLPKPISHTMVLCAEIVGAAGFRLLADKAQELFADQPKSLQRIEELFQQILVDEVGHVHYARSQLGSVRLKIAEKMLPLVGHYLMRDIPEFELLFGREKMMETILKADVDSAVVSYADRFAPIYR